MRNFHKFLGGSLSKYSLCFMLRAIFICYLKNHWRLSDQGRDLCPVKEIECFVALEDIGRNSAPASSKEENIDLLCSKNGFQMKDSKESVCGTCRNYSAVNKRVHLLISPSQGREKFFVILPFFVTFVTIPKSRISSLTSSQGPIRTLAINFLI